MNLKLFFKSAFFFILSTYLFGIISCAQPINNETPGSLDFVGTWTYTGTDTKEKYILSRTMLIAQEFSPPDSYSGQSIFAIESYDVITHHIYAKCTSSTAGIPLDQYYFITYSIDANGGHFAMATDKYPDQATTNLYIKS